MSVREALELLYVQVWCCGVGLFEELWSPSVQLHSLVSHEQTAKSTLKTLLDFLYSVVVIQTRYTER